MKNVMVISAKDGEKAVEVKVKVETLLTLTKDESEAIIEPIFNDFAEALQKRFHFRSITLKK